MRTLPGNLGDMPPPLAERAEQCRRLALDWLFAHDYRLFAPPLAEHLETLTAGDKTLDVDTFKMTDTLSGETLGLRADHTQQVLRYDRAAKEGGVRRYCYCGAVIRAHPPQPWKSREEMQIGAEMFGAQAPGGEMEIARVAGGMLSAIGVEDIAVTIAHAGIVRRLFELSGINENAREEVLKCFALRDSSRLRSIAKESGADGETLANLCAIADTGDDAVARARKLLPKEFEPALNEIAMLCEQLSRDGGDAEVDFSDIGGYGYHTGAVFVFYANNFVAARGGRYDRGESAVGFSANLREIAECLPPAKTTTAIACPLSGAGDEEWQKAVATLQKSGRRLRFVHDGEKEQSAPCLQKNKNGKWEVREQ